jgi:hypothetical protein
MKPHVTILLGKNWQKLNLNYDSFPFSLRTSYSKPGISA